MLHRYAATFTSSTVECRICHITKWSKKQDVLPPIVGAKARNIQQAPSKNGFESLLLDMQQTASGVLCVVKGQLLLGVSEYGALCSDRV